MDLSTKGINDLQKWLESNKKWIERKTSELVDRLADRGVHLAQIYFSTATYDGDNDVKVTVERRGENAAAVIATGKATLFIEFGAGYMMGQSAYASEYGYGAGTYPGQTHAFDPEGWYLPKNVQAITGKEKSFGNPPAAPMYVTVKDLEMELEKLAREVFA